MRRIQVNFLAALLVAGCAAEDSRSIIDDLEEVDAVTVLDAPPARPGSYAPQNRYLVERGEYLVELLACGACHTNGALIGEPDLDRPLAGSDIGIAFSSPLGNAHPGVVYPPNITPDRETGIGNWSDAAIRDAIRAGIGRHAGRPIATMPWQGYARMTDEDIDAIVSYLRSIEPVAHQTPSRVQPGQPAPRPYVYFGVYRSKR